MYLRGSQWDMIPLPIKFVQMRSAREPEKIDNISLGPRLDDCLQVALGISTLMLHVPVSLGSLHQANAMALLSLVICSLFALRPAASMNPVAAATAAARALEQTLAKPALRKAFA